jgi:arylsulfatase A-like enzyme
VVDETFRWGRMLAAERARGDRNPYFLYLHFMEPHLDYRPPSAFWSEEARAYDGPLDGSSRRLHKKIRSKTPFTAEDLAFLHAVYRGEVAFLDSQLRRLEEGLRALGLWSDETIFVLTADHGEQIGEHGEFEHGDVHVENVHVPLVIGAPGAPPHAVDQVVRLLDLAPTLLELLDAPPLPGAQGRSLVPLLFGGSLPAVASLTEHGERRRLTTETLSLVVDHGVTHLYDWTADPDEERDLAAARPAETAALMQALEEERRRFAAGSVPEAPARALDPETLEQLRALGYL